MEDFIVYISQFLKFVVIIYMDMGFYKRFGIIKFSIFSLV